MALVSPNSITVTLDTSTEVYNAYQALLLLITTTFLIVFLLQAAAKVQELCKGSKKAILGKARFPYQHVIAIFPYIKHVDISTSPPSYNYEQLAAIA